MKYLQVILFAFLMSASALAEPQTSRPSESCTSANWDLSKLLVGTWSIENKYQGDGHESVGQVTISTDGVYHLDSGSLAAAGIGSGEVSNSTIPSCNHDEAGQKYEVIGQAVAFSWAYKGYPDSFTTVIPTIVEVSKNRVVMVGYGGCGVQGHKVSILTRK